MLRGVCCWTQDGPGLYNDDAWEALDRVLDEARRAGLKVMLSFLDNWKYIGEPSSPCQHHVLTVKAGSAKALLKSPGCCVAILQCLGGSSGRVRSASAAELHGAALSALLLAMSGGVDEIVDWSRTAPKRKSERPADTAGDFDDKVRAILLRFKLVCSS